MPPVRSGEELGIPPILQARIYRGGAGRCVPTLLFMRFSRMFENFNEIFESFAAKERKIPLKIKWI